MQGVSTRKVKAITEERCGYSFGPHNASAHTRGAKAGGRSCYSAAPSSRNDAAGALTALGDDPRAAEAGVGNSCVANMKDQKHEFMLILKLPVWPRRIIRVLITLSRK